MEEIPDKNIFMMCRAVNSEAFTELPNGYHARSCRPEEFAIWKAMPFDDSLTAEIHDSFMEEFFKTTYKEKEAEFFSKTLFICNAHDQPIATCLLWKAYNMFTTVHWFKVVKEYEGKGIGRALLSILMRNLEEESYPVYLHTQPASYRAIKLYTDFGFQLLAGATFGVRQNDLEECLPILKKYMPEKDFQNLQITEAPQHFHNFLQTTTTIQF